MKWQKLIPYAVVLGGFAIGCVVFLPVDRLVRDVAAKTLARAGFQLDLGRAHLGTGLGIGLGNGSLIALRADRVQLGLPSGGTLNCDEFILAPQILPLFMGRATAGFSCEMGKSGSLDGRLSASPVWAPKNLDITIEPNAVDLRILQGLVSYGPLEGHVSGEVLIENWPLGSRNMPPVKWTLEGRDVRLPSLESDLLTLPSMRLGPLKTHGRLENAKLVVDELGFGNGETPLEGNFKINFGLDRMMPVSGDLSGTLRTAADFERNSMRDLNLDLIFGKVKASGRREFKKVVQGNALSLLMSPPSE